MMTIYYSFALAASLPILAAVLKYFRAIMALAATFPHPCS